MNLAAGQAAVRAVVAVLAAGPEFVAAVHLSSSPAHWLADLWPNWDSATAWVLVTWTALGPGSLAFLLQMYGQRTVPAPSAQVSSCLPHIPCPTSGGDADVVSICRKRGLCFTVRYKRA